MKKLVNNLRPLLRWLKAAEAFSCIENSTASIKIYWVVHECTDWTSHGVELRITIPGGTIIVLPFVGGSLKSARITPRQSCQAKRLCIIFHCLMYKIMSRWRRIGTTQTEHRQYAQAWSGKRSKYYQSDIASNWKRTNFGISEDLP